MTVSAPRPPLAEPVFTINSATVSGMKIIPFVVTSLLGTQLKWLLAFDCLFTEFRNK
jgi:hypothetical protein